MPEFAPHLLPSHVKRAIDALHAVLWTVDRHQYLSASEADEIWAAVSVLKATLQTMIKACDDPRYDRMLLAEQRRALREREAEYRRKWGRRASASRRA